MYSLIILSIVVAIVVVSVMLVSWSTHISMTKNYTLASGWGNYKKFKKYFEAIEWDYDESFKRSLFSSGTASEYHADILKFNGNGMIINNPISYLLVRVYVYKYIDKNFKTKIKW